MEPVPRTLLCLQTVPVPDNAGCVLDKQQLALEVSARVVGVEAVLIEGPVIFVLSTARPDRKNCIGTSTLCNRL